MAIAEQEGGELDPDAFEQLAQASKRFDGLANTLKALEAFDNIQDLLEKVGETKEEFEQIKDQLSDHNKQLKHAQATLDLFKDLQSKGYDTDFLDMFRQFVTRYSKNSRMPAAVLEQIVNKISSLEELVAAERQALAKAAEAENRRKTKEIEHAALAKSIEFANLLLFKHKFSPETIDRLVKQTQVYGGIDGFLTALENFRRIEDLGDTEQTLKANLSRLRGEEKGLINSAQRLRGQAEDAANSLQSLVSSAITNIKRQLEESIQRISDETRQEISVSHKTGK
jgi:ABC-type transporter Mla subunit MlaD